MSWRRLTMLICLLRLNFFVRLQFSAKNGGGVDCYFWGFSPILGNIFDKNSTLFLETL
jgi:hypothetical protein